MRTVTVIIPDHLESEMEQLCAHYAVPLDFMAQKLMVDGITEIYETRVLDHRRKLKEVES